MINILNDEYHINNLSTVKIVEKYKLTSTQRLDGIFKGLNIKKRTMSDALVIRHKTK